MSSTSSMNKPGSISPSHPSRTPWLSSEEPLSVQPLPGQRRYHLISGEADILCYDKAFQQQPIYTCLQLGIIKESYLAYLQKTSLVNSRILAEFACLLFVTTNYSLIPDSRQKDGVPMAPKSRVIT